MSRKLVVLALAGDGVGKEIMPPALSVLRRVENNHGLDLDVREGLVGGSAIDATGSPLPQESFELAKQADAVLLGAVGGPKWDGLPMSERPEQGILSLRRGLELFANLRPVQVFDALADASSLKTELVRGLDLLVVRELTGGIYFGEPRGIEVRDNERYGFNTLIYSESEIVRILRVAFEAARGRGLRVTSVDKANVLEATFLWRQVADEIAAEYPDVSLEHMLVDNAGMQLVRAPKQFDVLVTTNMFGDILSDVSAMLTGSLGMLPSASLGGSKAGLYEPVHGSAPDIAGQDIVNPLAMILSVALMLRHSLDAPEAARDIEEAVSRTLNDGFRTRDIMSCRDGTREVGTRAMAEAVVERLA